jgi:hypothetical protein
MILRREFSDYREQTPIFTTEYTELHMPLYKKE